MIAIVFAVTSYLLDNSLSDYARQGSIVVSLLVAQLVRLIIAMWSGELALLPLLGLLMIVALVTVILWLTFRPDTSAYLAGIAVSIFSLLYQIAFLVILFSILPGLSLTWIIDVALSLTIIYYSLFCYKQYIIKVKNRQELELMNIQ